MIKRLLLGTAALAILSACGTSLPAEPPVAELAATPAVEDGKFVTPEGLILSARDEWGDWGIDLSTRDLSVHPGDDFNLYANGAWINTFEIPADRTRYGSFDLLSEKSEQRVRKIIEELGAESPALDSIEGKVAAYFNAYMDTDRINASGVSSAAPMLERIAALSSREELAELFGTVGLQSPVGGWVDINALQTDQYIFYISQSGLGMGDRDYYLVDSPRNLELRAAYKDMLAILLSEAGHAEPEAAADTVLELETQIAKAHWDRTINRNRDITTNKRSREDLLALAGDFPAARMLETMDVAAEREFILRQLTPSPEAIAEHNLSEEDLEKISGGGLEALFRVMQEAPLASWQAYLSAHYLRAHADVLPERIDQAVFEFYGRQLTGAEEQPPRWRRAVSATQGALGEAVGEVYAARYFPPENKAAMDDLVANLRLAMADNLEALDWMGETTKAEARDKLEKFTTKIAYPEEFKDYSTLLVGDTAFANRQAASNWAWQDTIGKLGQPIDRNEWFMLPQTVNAYYSPTRNEIVFPAAILQPPFFNLGADPAVNYGAIGGVIGHEIGHGFDDQGSRSDGDGVLRNWWTPEDQDNFRALTDALVSQYNAFCPLDDGQTCVNGRLALGENIGDLGGLSMAYKAYRLSLGGEDAPVIDGLTGDQRFFMGWAQIWRAKYREEALRRQLQQGPHSPPEYRINGIVRNFDEWYEAFDVGPDHALYLPPEERIRIW